MQSPLPPALCADQPIPLMLTYKLEVLTTDMRGAGTGACGGQ